jgi:general secretion pathway protein D
MNLRHHSERSRWAPLIAILLLAGCASNRIHDEGMQLAAQGDQEAALAKLQEASRLEPTNANYRIDLIKATLAYGLHLVARADEARRNGNASEAAALYKKALEVSPGNDRARYALVALELDARSNKLLAESEQLLREGKLAAAQEKVDAALAENPGNARAQQQAASIREQIDVARQARAAQVGAQSIMRKPVTLQFRDANLRMVFEALSRTTGLNVILDRDVRADLKTTIFVKDASVEDTVGLILLQNQLEKRTLNANTLFIYPATAAKQKEYQDLHVRTFQITNGDAKYLNTMLKAVLKLKDVSVDERANTIVVRDTPEALAVAAKVIAASDVPEPEVMLEVEVLEISRTRAQNIGLQLPTSFTVATPTSADTIGALKALTRNDLTASGLSVTLNLQQQDTDANLLASPRIRARNKEKAKIMIGDRVPTVTNSVVPAGTSSVVTGTVTYQDVGLKLEFEPTVYNSLEVGIKLNLEVSNIVDVFKDVNGSRSYQIGTRNAQTSLRLRDGETQILGGLISDLDRYTASKIPGIASMPVVGSIFANHDTSHNKTEIVLSITPRILRAPANVDAALREIFSGTENSVRERALQLDAIASVRGQSSGDTAAAPAAAPTRPPVTAGAVGGGGGTAPAAPSSAPAAPSTAPVAAAGATEAARNMLQFMNNYRPGARAAPAAATGQAVPQPQPAEPPKVATDAPPQPPPDEAPKSPQ